ncbi:MAG: hypothetical protein H7Y30_09645, partial [Pyrinomonadaceae bacterium]|nr:hypothetical protein [Pyrinomonadaceae bacterium]
MSTSITETTHHPAVKSEARSKAFSFDNLIEKLSTLDRAPTLEEINGWMLEVRIDAADIHPHLGFKAATYARHRVFRNDYAELLLLC